MIRSVEISDSSQIANIYNYYVLNTIVTFELTPVSDEEMSERIKKVIAKYPWFVYEENGRIQGYTYASPWKPRGAYSQSVESTVYLLDNQVRRGIGSKLYSKLIAQLKTQNMHSIMGGIGLPNIASIALHEKFGFKKVAHFNEVGYKFNKWIDVAYWQLII